MKQSRRNMLGAVYSAGLVWACGMVWGETTVPMKTLKAGMSVDQVTAVLEHTFLGRKISELPAAIEGLDGKVVAIIDLAQSEVETGTPLSEGVRAGDPVLSVMIGLSRGFFRADEVVGAYAWYEDDKITGLSAVGIRRK